MGVLNCIPTFVMLIGHDIGTKSTMPASPGPLDDTPPAPKYIHFIAPSNEVVCIKIIIIHNHHNV